MDLVIFTSSKKCIVLNNWLLLEKITASRPGCRSKMGFYWCFLKVGCLPRCKKPRMHAGNLASKKKNMSGTKNWRNPVEAVGFPAYGYRKSPNPQFTGEQKVLSYLHFRYRTNPLVIRNFVQLHNDLLSAAGVLSTKEIVLEWHFGNFSRLAPQSIYIYIYASPPPKTNILTPGRCSCVRALFSMLMWKSYRNSEDKLSLQVACTMLPNQLFVFHWANVSKLFCICMNFSLPNLLFISKKFGL